MARQWRIEFNGSLYHVLSSGNQQQPIFRDDKDRCIFLDIIGDASERFAIEICPIMNAIIEKERANRRPLNDSCFSFFFLRVPAISNSNVAMVVKAALATNPCFRLRDNITY